MAPTKRRWGKTRSLKRRTHWKITAPAGLGICSNPECREPVLPHHACPKCMTYKGRKVGQTIAEE